jgi:hypothetical protein
MLVIFFILMCTASLTLHKTIDLTVHNQYSDIELASPAYFHNCEIYNQYSIKRTNAGIMLKTGFRFGLDQNEPGGILMYKVKRKENAESNYQSSTNTTSVTHIEDTLRMMQLLVAWKTDHPQKFNVRIVLVEHVNEFVLNETKLAQLYSKINDMPSEVYDWILKYGSICKSKWLMCNNKVLEATDEKLIYGKDELKINISEGAEDKDTMKPMRLDPEK